MANTKRLKRQIKRLRRRLDALEQRVRGDSKPPAYHYAMTIENPDKDSPVVARKIYRTNP